MIMRGDPKKLAEAAGYAKSMRNCILAWIKDTVTNTDNLSVDLQSVEEAIELANQCENLRMKLDIKGRR